MASKKGKKKEEIGELNQEIWAVIDGINVLASSLTYDEASRQNQTLNGTIVTNEAASRLNHK